MVEANRKRGVHWSTNLLLAVSLAPCRPASALQIGPLLSTCVDACRRGCREIRSVQADRERLGGELSVELKNVDDARSALTKADAASQRAIVGALRAEWGTELNIVGEEDDDDELMSSFDGKTFEPLNRDMFEDDIGETPEIDAEDVTVFVDPLDGTREFVEGRLSNCQVLVGITVGGVSAAGAIGIPFPAGDLSTEPTIVYGLADVGTGVIGEPLARGPFPLDHHIDGLKYPRPHIATGDSPAKIMVSCRDLAIERFGGSNVIYGGAGNKILAAALGEVACTIQHKYGGPWDLCAPEAVLKAMGGRITDLCGDEIVAYRKDAPPRCNERGYVATPSGSPIYHDALTKALRESKFLKEYLDNLV